MTNWNIFAKDDQGLEPAIQKAYKELDRHLPGTTEYITILKQIGKLNALKQKRVDPTTALLVGGNLLVAAIVVGFEMGHPMTTKVLGFLAKVK